MLKKITKIILGVALISLFTGCVTNVEFVNNNNNIANENIKFENVLLALNNSDYSLIRGQLSNELKQDLTENNFKVMVETLNKNGEIVEFVFLDNLRFPAISTEVWKMTFKKEDANKEVEYRDKLVKVMYTNLDGREQIIAILIQ